MEQQLRATQTKCETSTKTGVVYKEPFGKFCAGSNLDINNSDPFNNNNNPFLKNSFDNNIGMNDSTETTETKAAETTQNKRDETTPKPS